jgi:hypothetical protein
VRCCGLTLIFGIDVDAGDDAIDGELKTSIDSKAFVFSFFCEKFANISSSLLFS